MTVFYVVLAGTLGCVCRFGIEEVVERQVLSHRPYATMFINALGASIAGFVVFGSSHWTSAHHVESIQLIRDQPYLLAGFCGGFTTFSSAIAIPLIDWQRGRRWRATTLIALTPILCILGFWLGEQLVSVVLSYPPMPRR